MPGYQVHCVVVQLGASGARPDGPADRCVRELLPWADPYIAQLVAALERDRGDRVAGPHRGRSVLERDFPD